MVTNGQYRWKFINIANFILTDTFVIKKELFYPVYD